MILKEFDPSWARVRLPKRIGQICFTCVCVLAVVSCSTPPKPAPVVHLGASPEITQDGAQGILGERLSESQAQEVALFAFGLVGTPYHWGGNTPDTGFDCSGFIDYVVSHQTHLKPPRTVTQLRAWGVEVLPEQRRTGDLIFFGSGPTPTHAGIYVGKGRFVHAPSTGGVVHLSHLSDAYWQKLQVNYRRP
jgi:cell wall-associated NlpC family hydrolase